MTNNSGEIPSSVTLWRSKTNWGTREALKSLSHREDGNISTIRCTNLNASGKPRDYKIRPVLATHLVNHNWNRMVPFGSYFLRIEWRKYRFSLLDQFFLSSDLFVRRFSFNNRKLIMHSLPTWHVHLRIVVQLAELEPETKRERRKEFLFKNTSI